MSLQRGSRQAHRRLSSAVFESLEQRKLLTTVLAGQTFEFVQITDGGSVIVRLAVDDPTGKGQVDIIGATLIPDGAGGQTPILNQIPGVINDEDEGASDRFGGLGGADGVEPIDVITGAPNSLTNVDYSNIGGPPLDAPQGAIHYDAMSSDTTGRTYALTLEEFNEETAIALINVDYTVSGSGVALQDLAGAIVGLTGAEGTDDIQAVVAADFLPSDNTKLYFVVVVSVDRFSLDSGEPVATDVPFLFFYDFAAPDPASAVNLVRGFQSDPGANAAERIPDVFGFTFDDDDNLIAYVTARRAIVAGGEVDVEEQNGLVVLDRTSPTFDFDQTIEVTVDNDPVDIYGLEFVAGDTGFIYAIEGDGAASRLIHVDYEGPGAGVGVDFGPLPDPDDNAGARRGENLSDLVWNPKYLNTFRIADDNPANDNKRGALIAHDTASDELVFVDTAQRFPVTNLYALHFSNGSPNMSVSVATVPAITANVRPMQPFTGNAGSIRHPDAQGGDELVTATPTGTGGVLIGAKTRDFYDNIDNEDLLPIRRIRKTPAQNFGNFPQTAKYVYSGISGVGDIGNLLVGGTVMGRVAIEGSVAGNLYAGLWLPGDPAGRLQGADYSDVRGNFYVSGDARNILSLSSVGSISAAGNEPSYLTGSDVVVGGKAGYIQTLNSMYGNVTANNSFKGLNQAIREIEDRRGNQSGAETYFQGLAGGTPSLGGNASYNNDTLATAQFVGTHLSSAHRSDEVAVIHGRLNNTPQVQDGVDYYAMALLAGQTITVQLDSRQIPMNVGVFDADDRLIATDRSDLGTGVVAGKPFQVKIDRPGIYKFAIARRDDVTFSGTSSLLAMSQYTLRITNTADVALGGLVAGGDIYSYDITPGRTAVRTIEGDVGAVQATNIFDDTEFSYFMDKGNLRAVVAGNIGIVGTIDAGIELNVPRGDVGLIRNTGAIMRLNELVVFLDPLTGLPDPSVAVGRDIQWIDSTGTFSGGLSANRAIGNIHADTYSSQASVPYLIANADRIGNDGVIDLADVTSWGGSTGGGPEIYTGPGGNFRYLRVSGSMFGPSQFGGVQQILPTTFDPGFTARFVDDSGADVKITPTPLVRDFSFPGTGEFVNPGQLTVWTYPVADSDKNGVIIARVTESGGGANHGILVESGTTGPGGSVEIGEVVTTSGGRTITETPTTVIGGQPSIALPNRRLGEGLTFGPDGLSPLDLVFKGTAPIDVWSILGQGGTIDSIENSTSGEIVNVRATSIGDISAETIGLAKSSTGANRQHTGNAVMSNIPLDLDAIFGGVNTTPMVQPRVGVVVTNGANPAYLISARSRQGLGNIFVQGIISSIVPNANRKNVKGVHEGINAPIVAVPTSNAANVTDARIISINIGEGLLPSGTGAVPMSGIFVGDHLGTLSNQGQGSDIRGDVLVGYLPFIGTGALGQDALLINSIELTNGAIINADIGVISNLDAWQESVALNTGFLAIEPNDTTTSPRFDIGAISLEGNGGIIGTTFSVADMGPIVIDGGFGFINSVIDFPSDGTGAGIDTTGYGIRDSQVFGGTYIDTIIARGTGKRIATTSFTPSVRQSQGKEGVDPYSGQLLNEMNDLHRYLGTTEKTPKIKGISNDGVIEDSQFAAADRLNSLSAHRITGRQRTTRVQFGNQINNIDVADSVDNLLLSTGRLRNFRTGNDVSYSQIGVAGQAENVFIGGTFRGTARLTVTGPQGRLLKMQTKRALFGTVNVVNDIGSLRVGTDLGSSSLRGLADIDTLNIAGNILTGARADFRNGTITNLTVGGDIQSDAIVRAQSIVNQNIGGEIFGDIIIG